MNNSLSEIDIVLVQASALHDTFDCVFFEAQLLLDEAESQRKQNKKKEIKLGKIRHPQNLEYILTFLLEKKYEKQTPLKGSIKGDLIFPQTSKSNNYGCLIGLTGDELHTLSTLYQLEEGHRLFSLIIFLYKKGFFADSPEYMQIVSEVVLRYSSLFQSCIGDEIETIKKQYFRIVGPQKALPHYKTENTGDEILGDKELLFHNICKLIELGTQGNFDSMSLEYFDQFLIFLQDIIPDDFVYTEKFGDTIQDILSLQSKEDTYYGLLLIIFCDFVGDNFELMEQIYKLLIEYFIHNKEVVGNVRNIFHPYRVLNSSSKQ